MNGSDLYKSGYAAGAFHIVENQLVKAAWRLAGWLNTLARAGLADSVDEDYELPEMVRTGRTSFSELPGQVAFGQEL